MSYKHLSFSELLGKMLTSVVVAADKESIQFTSADGTRYEQHHAHDYAHVRVEDICGDLNDLIGVPILQAEESSNRDKTPAGLPEPQESYTWTFYRLATIKGSVVIRWLGESNGYYSEEVFFSEITN